MRITKKLKTICLLLVSVLSLSACSMGGGVLRKDPFNSGNNSGENLSGNINITMPINTRQRTVLQSVIDAYNEIHPLVSVTITNSSTEGYKGILQTQLASEDMNDVSFDIVANNSVSQYFSPEKFINYTQYLADENPYCDNMMWKDCMNSYAYSPIGANGEVYYLCFDTTTVRFFYNKDILEDAGVNAETDFDTWEEFLASCQKIQTNTGKSALAIAGDTSSFYELQMSWILRAYTDQYFRSSVIDFHSVEGDWNYSPKIDADWEYKPYASDYPEISDLQEAWQMAYDNDSRKNYTYNELRVLKGIQQGTYGPANKKYQNMLANLLEIKPYVLSGFTGNNYEKVYNSFFNGDAAIIVSTLDFFNEVRNRPNFTCEVGSFSFPVMSANTKYQELASYGPDVNYTRSVSGPIGYYGIVNKNPEQTKLVLDFMKFWSSPRGQQLAMDKRAEINEYAPGISLINGVTTPDSINSAKGIEIHGMADNNPALLFARGLSNEPVSTNGFTNNITALFNISSPTYADLRNYGDTMQGVLNANMSRYFVERGYKSNCLDNVAANPF